MAAQPPQQGNDNSYAPIFLSAALLLVVGGTWYFAHQYIVQFVFFIKLVEISLMGSFIHTLPLQSIQQFIQSSDPGQIKVMTLLQVCDQVGRYIRYPLAALMCGMGILLLMRSSGLRYRTAYNMKKLAHKEVKNWPQIAPVLNLDLVKKKLDDGPWAMALSPMHFAKKNKLLQEERKPLAEGTLMRQSQVTVTLIKGAAHRVFALQLGRLWQGVDALTQPQKALFAICVAKAHGDNASARKLMSQISASTSHGKLNYHGTDVLIKKYAQEKAVQQIINKHAYVLTVMASLLEFARTDGVLASAEFLWLKPLDRSLWYMLNTVGRRTAIAEIAGAHAHWLVERELDRKIIVPMVDEAVIGLEKAVQEILYIPDAEKK